MWSDLPTLLALGLSLSSTAHAASAAQWRSRSIYQVLTDRYARTDGSTTAKCNTGDRVYCGGTYKGLINHLDYIQGMGFDAVWISPVTQQIDMPSSFHGYWQNDLYALNNKFGTAQDLKDLSSALHARGMYLMVDVVVNHMAYNGGHASVEYSTLKPFNQASQYHPYCTINYDINNVTNIQDCWIADNPALPDVRTEDSDIVQGFSSWISQLVSNYSIDGIRMDTAMQVDTAFWSTFNRAANSYIVGEIYVGDIDFVCSYLDYLPGVLNYGAYFPLIQAFQNTSGSITNLATSISTINTACTDTSVLGTFSENHDQPRFASLTGDMALAKNVVTFTMLTDGIPIIYAGQEQHYNALGGSNDPYNREATWFSKYNTDAELYKLIATSNALRKTAAKNDASYLTRKNAVVYTDATTIAMKKGSMLVVLSNKGANGAAYTQVIPAQFSPGQKVMEVLGCREVTADGSGRVSVAMGAGEPKVFYPSDKVGGLCSGSSTRRRSLMRFMRRD